jgi:hypothetical protein
VRALATVPHNTTPPANREGALANILYPEVCGYVDLKADAQQAVLWPEQFKPYKPTSRYLFDEPPPCESAPMALYWHQM